MVRKLEECLQNISTGLALNEGQNVESMLIFVHGVVSLSIPQLKLPQEKTGGNSDASVGGKPLKTDSFIIAAAPKRKSAAQPTTTTATSRSAYVTNSHLFVEFGLLTLHLLMKQEKYSATEVLPMLDPFVVMIHDNLHSQHAKVSIFYFGLAFEIGSIFFGSLFV